MDKLLSHSFSILILLLFSGNLFDLTPTSMVASSPATIRLDSHLYDFKTRLPIPNVNVTLYLSSEDGILFTFQGVSLENGLVIYSQRIPDTLSPPFRLDRVKLSGVWIVNRIVGDREYNLWEERKDWSGPIWLGDNVEAFFQNQSDYVFPLSLYGKHIQSDHGYRLVLDLYLTPGRLLNLTFIHPFYGIDQFSTAVPQLWAMKYWQSFYWGGNRYVKGNFAPINYVSAVVAPRDESLKLNISVGVFSDAGRWQERPLKTWTCDIQWSVGDRFNVDLTPLVMQIISDNAVNELKLKLDELKSYEFPLSSNYIELGRMRSFFGQAISAFERGETVEGIVLARKAYEIYSRLSFTVEDVKISTIPSVMWVVLTLIFFSVTLAALLTEQRRRTSMISLALFFLTLSIFVHTQPYLKLFFARPLALIENMDPKFLGFLIQHGLPGLLIFVFLGMSQHIRDIFWQTFEVALKNLRRRPLRTTLTILTILTVSASSMSLLSVTYSFSRMEVKLPQQPTVSDGMVIYKYYFANVSSYSTPLESHEIKWLQQRNWVQNSSIYGIKIVSVSNTSSTTLPYYNQFFLAALMPSFAEKYSRVSTVLGAGWLTDEDRGYVWVGENIASAYQLKVGSDIFINGQPYKVKGVFNERDVAENVKEIDGNPIFFKIYDPGSKTVNSPPTVYPPYPWEKTSFIIGSVYDFGYPELSVYKVSIIPKTENVSELNAIAENLQWYGYEKGQDYTRTFAIYLITDSKVTCMYFTYEALSLVGPWQTQTVPIMLGAMIVFATLHGSVFERKKEIKTMSALGINPLRIGVMFLAEGLTLGIQGGIIGYMLGYTMVRVGKITLLTSVEETFSTGAPLIVAISIAVIVSIAGCLIPSKEAILTAVPSKKLLQKCADIIHIQGNVAFLDTPLRISKQETNFFDRFMQEILNRHPSIGTPHGMFAINVKKNETRESIIYNLIICYASERTAHFLVKTSLLKEQEPMSVKTTIFPIDPLNEKTMSRWTADHKYLLPRLASTLRSDFLEYSEWKRTV